MSTDTAHPTTCPDCRGHGPAARIDGHRFDSAGPDFPCPDCGVTARQARLRCQPTAQDDRGIAIDVLRAMPELVRFGREHCADEPLDSLARTVADTAHSLGLGYLEQALVPWDAIEATRREWERLERLKARH